MRALPSIMLVVLVGCGGGGGGGATTTATPAPAQAATIPVVKDITVTTVNAMTGVEVFQETASDALGVASVLCSLPRTVTGGGCRCGGLGVIFSSRLSGNGWVCACTLLVTADVYAVCASATRVPVLSDLFMLKGTAVSSKPVMEASVPAELTSVQIAALVSSWIAEQEQMKAELREQQRLRILNR